MILMFRVTYTPKCEKTFSSYFLPAFEKSWKPTSLKISKVLFIFCQPMQSNELFANLLLCNKSVAKSQRP